MGEIVHCEQGQISRNLPGRDHHLPAIRGGKQVRVSVEIVDADPGDAGEFFRHRRALQSPARVFRAERLRGRRLGRRNEIEPQPDPGRLTFGSEELEILPAPGLDRAGPDEMHIIAGPHRLQRGHEPGQIDPEARPQGPGRGAIPDHGPEIADPGRPALSARGDIVGTLPAARLDLHGRRGAACGRGQQKEDHSHPTDASCRVHSLRASPGTKEGAHRPPLTSSCA